MLAIPNFKVFDADYIAAAIDLARKNSASFADSYIAAVAKDKNLRIATFNVRHFKKLGAELYDF
jgi:predicted nucleic acid-binding protein